MSPAVAPRATSPQMVGRDPELRALGEFVAGLREREPGVALVCGRAGMGKTRLVGEVARRWRGAARVLVGGCVPEGPPYTPLMAALRPALPPTAPVVRMLVARQAATRSELFDALGASLAGLGGRSPLVLVIEDLHWSDRATRDALAYLVTPADVGRWGLVATLRYEGPITQTELVAFTDVLERRPVLRVALEPRTPGQVADQVAGITGTAPSLEVAAAIHRRSGGIPLLVEEVVAGGDRGACPTISAACSWPGCGSTGRKWPRPSRCSPSPRPAMNSSWPTSWSGTSPRSRPPYGGALTPIWSRPTPTGTGSATTCCARRCTTSNPPVAAANCMGSSLRSWPVAPMSTPPPSPPTGSGPARPSRPPPPISSPPSGWSGCTRRRPRTSTSSACSRRGRR